MRKQDHNFSNAAHPGKRPGVRALLWSMQKQNTLRLPDIVFRSKSGNDNGSKPNHTRRTSTRLVVYVSAFLCALCLNASTVLAQTLPGTVLDNVAEVSFVQPSGNRAVVDSNAVSLVTQLAPTDATVQFVQIGNGGGDDKVINATQCVAGGGLVPLPDAQLFGGTTVTAGDSFNVVESELFHGGQPLFIQLEDADQNLDATMLDSINVTLSFPATGDVEELVLTETELNSGEFVGYVPTSTEVASVNDCTLQVLSGGQAEVRYTDPNDNVDVAASSALVDPLGVVFDSGTGMPVNGAEVTLINSATGLPARVFGDDGVSTYPSQIISGGSATDSGGVSYNFADGAFRFPLIAPGTYSLLISPPPGYSAPSVVPVGDLQQLPGAPYTLVAASFGGDFVVNPGPVIRVDIPLDPSSASLFLQKTTPLNVAAPGDFVPYELRLTNSDGVALINDVRITDRLPAGFRLVPDSVRVDGDTVADPVIAADGRTLTFLLDRLNGGQGKRVSYVTEVTNSVSGEEATNVAIASGSGDIESNTASTTIKLTEDIFATNSLLIGRVVDGSCDQDVSNDLNGVANTRVYLEDGRYAVTDEGGRFHFEGLEPGAHVVQLDVDSIPVHMEVMPCQQNSRFAGRAFSQFVDLRPGSAWRADFYLQDIPAENGAVDIMLETTPGQGVVDYTMSIIGRGNVDIRKLGALVMLPDGVEFVAGSAARNGAQIPNPSVNGSLLTFSLDERSGQWQDLVTFRAKVNQDASLELVTKAMAMFDAPTASKQRTPLVDNLLVIEPPRSERIEYTLTPKYGTRSVLLNVSDKHDIDAVIAELKDVKNIRIRIEGHTDNIQIAPQNRKEFANNTMLSEARAAGVSRYIQEQLKLLPSQLTVEGKGASEPRTSNSSSEGRAANRRVELMIWGEQQRLNSHFKVAAGSRLLSDMQSLDVAGASLRQVDKALVSDQVVDNFADESWVERVDPGFELLLPAEGENLAVPSLKVAVKHAPANRVTLELNGEPVSGLHYEGKNRNGAKTVSISRWRGVNVNPGQNALVVILSDRSGKELSRLTRNVHFSGGPVRAQVNVDDSNLIADGRQRPVIVLDTFDREDYPGRPEAVGVYEVLPPYRAQWEVDAARENQLVIVGDRDPVYTLNERGQAVIELEPTSQAGEVVLNLKFENGLEQEVRTWLRPATRDWILVGLAHGTVGYNSLKDNLENAVDDGFEEDYYEDGRVAFFAKGRVRGDYLMTLAYDTRGRALDEDRLFGTIDPDRFYTLYGDATDQRFDAASQEKLFLKIERNQFYALFGDHQTALTVTELARYSRSLNGFKSEYAGERFGYNVFASRTNQAFVKDEIAGDGTSGLYRLSRQPIIINSEKVTIEVRDRFRTELVLESRSMARHLDYNVDYLQGTLFFKQPVMSRSPQLNPVFIVVDYESRDTADDELIAGGRVSFKAGDRVEVGATGISEGMAGGSGELYGADIKVTFRPGTELRAEYATSDSVQNGASAEGDAYLIELRHQGEKLDGVLYTREQESGFGLGQQRGTESGTRKTGFSARMRMSPRLTLNADAYTQDNLGNGATRNVAQAEARYQAGRGTFGFGLRSASDEDENGVKNKSEQAFVNASVQALNDKLTLRGTTDFALSNSNANGDFPRRTLLGLDYRLNDRFTVFAEHEIADGDNIDAQTTRGGVKVTPWERANINATINQEVTEYGPRVFANVGLVQGIQLNEKVTVDLGFDHGNTVKDNSFSEFDLDTPPTSGSITEDFTSIFVGGLYRSDNWSATSRLEYRNSDSEQRETLQFGVYREENEGMGFSLNAQVFNSSAVNGVDALNADIRLGWAFRPADSKWVIFDRLDLGFDDVESLSSSRRTWKAVNNLNANWMISRDTQIDFQYGAKFVRSNFNDDSYTGFSDLVGLAYRHDLTPRFDVGFHGHVRHSWRANVYDYSVGLEAGMTVAKNAWLSVGYNVSGFEDDDFSQAGYLADGPYIKFRLKADQHTFDDFRRGMLFRREDAAVNSSRRRSQGR